MYTRKTLERLHIASGLGTPRGSPVGAGKYCLGEVHLDQDPGPNKRKQIDACTNFLKYRLLQFKVNYETKTLISSPTDFELQTYFIDNKNWMWCGQVVCSLGIFLYKCFGHKSDLGPQWTGND